MAVKPCCLQNLEPFYSTRVKIFPLPLFHPQPPFSQQLTTSSADDQHMDPPPLSGDDQHVDPPPPSSEDQHVDPLPPSAEDQHVDPPPPPADDQHVDPPESTDSNIQTNQATSAVGGSSLQQDAVPPAQYSTTWNPPIPSHLLAVTEQDEVIGIFMTNLNILGIFYCLICPKKSVPCTLFSLQNLNIIPFYS